MLLSLRSHLPPVDLLGLAVLQINERSRLAMAEVDEPDRRRDVDNRSPDLVGVLEVSLEERETGGRGGEERCEGNGGRERAGCRDAAYYDRPCRCARSDTAPSSRRGP